MENAKLLWKNCKIAEGNFVATVHLINENFLKKMEKIVKTKHQIENSKLLWKSRKIAERTSVATEWKIFEEKEKNRQIKAWNRKRKIVVKKL